MAQYRIKYRCEYERVIDVPEDDCETIEEQKRWAEDYAYDMAGLDDISRSDWDFEVERL